jgi:hypothetical protein
MQAARRANSLHNALDVDTNRMLGMTAAVITIM